MPGPEPLVYTPMCEATDFTCFVFNGDIDLTAVPFCANDASHALKAERPRPFLLCGECMRGYVHVLARCGVIPPVCPRCVDGSCAEPDPTNPYTVPEWHRDPERGKGMYLDENGEPA